MPTQFLIANLLQESQQPNLQVEAIFVQPTWHNDNCNSAVSVYKLQNGRTAADVMSTTYKTHCKATAKTHVAITILVQLLAGEATIKETAIDRLKTDEIRLQCDILPSATVGDSVAIVDEASDGVAIGTYSRNMFLPVYFEFPVFSEGKLSTICSTQYLQASAPSLKLNDALSMHQSTQAIESVNFVTGVCLYSDKILKASLSDSDGKLDAEKLSSAPATINELESIARCSSALADIAMMFISRTRNEDVTQPISITVNIPSWHYFWSIIGKFKEGTCTAREALKWMEAVERRHDQILHLFQSAIRHELQRRGARPEDANIQFSQKEIPATVAIKQALQNGEIPILEDLLYKFDSQSDCLWKDFYSLISEKDQPKDLQALGNLSYVFEVVKLALKKPITTTFSRPRLILSVDDRMENRIYSRARNLLKKLHSSARTDLPRTIFLEIYTARKLYVDGNKSRRRFFHYDPSPKILMSSATGVGGEDSRRRLCRPLDLIERLFDKEQVESLKICLAEAGLQ
ncbi:hypothetical protein ACLMJK_008716 [Lecanora helva]